MHQYIYTSIYLYTRERHRIREIARQGQRNRQEATRRRNTHTKLREQKKHKILSPPQAALSVNLLQLSTLDTGVRRLLHRNSSRKKLRKRVTYRIQRSSNNSSHSSAPQQCKLDTTGPYSTYT